MGIPKQKKSYKRSTMKDNKLRAWLKDNQLRRWLKDNRKRLIISYLIIFVASWFIYPPLAVELLLPILLLYGAICIPLTLVPLYFLFVEMKDIFSGFFSGDSHDRYGPDDGDAGE